MCAVLRVDSLNLDTEVLVAHRRNGQMNCRNASDSNVSSLLSHIDAGERRVIGVEVGGNVFGVIV